eukprot:TRINITY_DN31234_c0_g2_i3.p2 TRINITY_DN31234_c0_g2~~TRINITY_DN31234_c0_g2_i3.p2  ORF type:complete len:203 (+),score=67.35 TRINITY_DN31234_c0_g2_i3:64-672(+)
MCIRDRYQRRVHGTIIQERNRFVAMLNEREAINEELNQRLDTLQDQMNSVKKEKEKLESELREWKNKTDAHSANIKTQQGTISDLNSKIDLLMVENESMKKQIETLNSEKDDLYAEKDYLMKKLHDIEMHGKIRELDTNAINLLASILGGKTRLADVTNDARKNLVKIIGEGGMQGLSLIHISEPTRRTPISYAVFCLKKKK